jgi:37-kD nucleoid-associated bacterial protein
MLDFSEATIVRLSITWTGNKELNEGIVIPKSTLVSVNDFAHQVLLNTFFKPFEKNEQFHYFHHDEDLSHNVVYQACMQIFENPDTLSEQAAILTQRLYDYSTLPKITGGEFFIALFDAVQLQGEVAPAIGLFKIINKDSYLKVERTAESFALQVGEGIATGKLALAALVFGVDEAEGYRIMATDTVSKKDTPSVWLHQFLSTKPIEDNYFNTQHYIQMTSDFIKEKAAPKFGLDKSDTIDLLNRTSFYFKENENFEIADFAKTVFNDDEKQEAFAQFKEEYSQESEAPLADQFDISKQALRKSNKVFKNVIKLDENFTIHINSRRDLIERGFDEEKGKPYYKVYFEKEE